MEDSLKSVIQEYEEIQSRLLDPQIVTNREKAKPLYRRSSELEYLVSKARRYLTLIEQLKEAKTLAEEDDPEMKAMAEEEITNLEPEIEELKEELKLLLLPGDPNDSRNIILEIRAGTGGDEAALFAGEIFRMYSHYAEDRGWNLSITYANHSDLGGIKELVGVIEGENVYARMKYESGVHRVQRVPETETSGRIHTSAITVAILPEADEVEIEIDQKDLRIDRFAASGPGGQHVNRTLSAIRITHLPTDIVVSCQDEKSQHKNLAKAMRVLKSRLYDMELQKKESEVASFRRKQIGSGDRSEKIRTYNFPQSRVTDHRIGLTIYRLEAIMNGDINQLIDPLITEDQAEQLKEIGSQ